MNWRIFDDIIITNACTGSMNVKIENIFVYNNN